MRPSARDIGTSANTTSGLLADRIVDLHDENFDLGVRIGEVADTSLIRFKPGQVHEVTVVSPRNLKGLGTPLSPSGLSGHDTIQHSSLGAFESWWFHTPEGRSEKAVVKARFAINQTDAAIAAARAGRPRPCALLSGR